MRWLWKFSSDCSEWCFLIWVLCFGILHKDEQVLGTALEHLVSIVGLLLELLVPEILVLEDDFGGQKKRGSTDYTREILEHFDVDKWELEDILGEVFEARIGFEVADLEVAVEEAVGGGVGEVEVEVNQNHALHGKNFLLGVGLVADVDEVLDLGGVDFLILAGYEKTCDSDELEFLSLDGFRIQKSIDEIYAHVERFWEELKIDVNVHEPIYKDGSHFFIDIILNSFHVSFVGDIVNLNFGLNLEW